MNDVVKGSVDGLNNLGSLALGVGLLCVFLISLLKAGKKHPAAAGGTTMVGIIGVVAGVGLLWAAQMNLGYKLMTKEQMLASGGSQTPGAMGAGGGPGGGGGMGGGAPGGAPGGGRGGFQASPSRQLTTAVRKLALLTGNIRIELSREKGVQLAEMLKGIAEKEAVSDTEAEEMNKALMDKLTEEQRAALDAISLPRQRGGAGGPGGPGGPRGGEGGNPFQSGTAAEAVKSIIARFGAASASPAPVAPKNPPEKSGK